MKNTIILLSIFFTSLWLLTGSALASDQVYRWVDDNGVVHFSDQPDASSRSEIVKITPPPRENDQTVTKSPQDTSDKTSQSEPSYAQKLHTERIDKQKADEKRKQELAANCDKQRRWVARLEPHPRVMVRSKDGTVTRMDDNKRLALLNEAKTFIEQNCNK